MSCTESLGLKSTINYLKSIGGNVIYNEEESTSLKREAIKHLRHRDNKIKRLYKMEDISSADIERWRHEQAMILYRDLQDDEVIDVIKDNDLAFRTGKSYFIALKARDSYKKYLTKMNKMKDKMKEAGFDLGETMIEPNSVLGLDNDDKLLLNNGKGLLFETLAQSKETVWNIFHQLDVDEKYS